MRSLSARLVLVTVAGTIALLAVLLVGFNFVVDARLGADADNLLRERAVEELRTVAVLDGKLRVAEAPDNAAPDTQTWIFAGANAIEVPVTDPRNDAVARTLAPRAPAFITVSATDSRLYAVPIVDGGRRLGTVVVAASLRPYDSSKRTALIGSLVLGILIVLLMTGASWWMVRRALAPVADMTAKAADWGEHDLARRFYVGEPHDELTRLAATFDQLLERLAQSLRREQRFTAEISHELRTPLAKIVAEAELAAARERSPDQYRGALESIRLAAEELSMSLDALLATARTEAGVAASTIDPGELAGRVAASARRDGVAVEIRGVGASVRVGAEPELIERALAPVVDNAVRHATGQVEITVARDDGILTFMVDDDGPGVEPDLGDRIFEPGVSGPGGTGSGAGLGLPLARRLARAAGGEVERLAVARGARFSVRFPLA